MKKRMKIDVYKNGSGPVLMFAIMLDSDKLPNVKEAIDGIIRELMSGEYNELERLKIDISMKYSEQNDAFSMNVYDDDKLTRVKTCFMDNPVMKQYGIVDMKAGKILKV